MPTAADRTRFRRKVGDNGTPQAFTDDEIDDIFAEAGDAYDDDSLIMAEACVLGIEALLADSAKLTSYKQGQSSESLSDIFKHLKELLGSLKARRNEILNNLAGGGIRILRMRKADRIVETSEDF